MVRLPIPPRGSLFRRYALVLFAAVAVPLLAAGGSGAWFGYRDQRDRLDDLLGAEARLAATRIYGFLDGITGQLAWTVQMPWTAGGDEARRIEALRLLRRVPAVRGLALIDGGGRERVSVSRTGLNRTGSGLDRSGDPAVAGARAGHAWYGPVGFFRDSEPVMAVAVAVAGDRGAGVAVAEVNLKLILDVVAAIRAALWRTAGLLVAGAAFAAALAYGLAARLSRPIRLLEDGAARIGAGRFDHRIALASGDELGRLAPRFNAMARELAVSQELSERIDRLKRFLAPQVAELVDRAGDDGVLDGRRVEVVAVFGDLRGFTAFSARSDPETIMGVIGAYYEALGAIAARFEATLTQFSGDGVMVLVNAPVPCPDPALRAVAMAVAMRGAARALVAEWRARGHALGFGVGLALGPATVGRVGAASRLDYTAIGNPVNLAARLCACAEDGQILVDPEAARAVGARAPLVSLGTRALKGYDAPVPVFAVGAEAACGVEVAGGAPEAGRLPAAADPRRTPEPAAAAAPPEGRAVRRRDLLGAGLGAGLGTLARPRPARGAVLPVIGYLGSESPERAASRLDAFHQGLAEAGFVEGRDVTVVFRWADGRYDVLPRLAAELVARPVDVLVAPGGAPVVLAAKAATATTPIVFEMGGDPTALGVVGSLSRPGGNLTGVSSLSVEVSHKRLELLRECVPEAKTFAVAANPTSPTLPAQLASLRAAADSLGVALHVLEAAEEAAFEALFTAPRRLGAAGLVFTSDPYLAYRSRALAGLAARHAVPAVTQSRDFPRAGGLMSYGGDFAQSHRQAGIYAGRVLRGERPADLPVQLVTRLELFVNLKAAAALGLAVPAALLAAADVALD